MEAWRHDAPTQGRFPRPLDRDRQRFIAWWTTGAGPLHPRSEFTGPLSVSVKAQTVRRRLGRYFDRRPVLAPDPTGAAQWQPSPELRDPTAFRVARRQVDRLRTSGLNIVGHFASASGLGEATRATLRSVRHSGVAYRTFDVGPGRSVDIASDPSAPFAATVIHDNAALAHATLTLLGARMLLARYNVGYWYWELDRLPASAVAALQYLDEVWTPSEFVARTIAEAFDGPVRTFPPAVDVSERGSAGRVAQGLPERPFLFLTMASSFSVLDRKNPIGVIDAFRIAFGDTPPNEVQLVVKATGLSPDERRTLDDAADGLAVTRIESPMTRADVLALIANCDALVSLHRSEGFGLPLAEAMALGKPTVATNYSGNVDFTTPETSFVVPYQLVELDQPRGPYEAGQWWADPDLDVAAAQMRAVLADDRRRQTVAKAAQEFVGTHYSPAAVGPAIASRVRAIASSSSSAGSRRQRRVAHSRAAVARPPWPGGA
jgi:glycosyltransferase involved in cell wall biosynthesis